MCAISLVGSQGGCWSLSQLNTCVSHLSHHMAEVPHTVCYLEDLFCFIFLVHGLKAFMTPTQPNKHIHTHTHIHKHTQT